jgi:hypothetical protein
MADLQSGEENAVQPKKDGVFEDHLKQLALLLAQMRLPETVRCQILELARSGSRA